MIKLYEVAGIDDLEGEVFAHCTSKENAERAMGFFDQMEDVLEIRESLIPINAVIIDDEIIDITVNTPCMLIKTIDRKITSMGTFPDEKQAYKTMEEDVAKELGLESVPESWGDAIGENEGYFFILSKIAWLSKNKNIDWAILPVEL